MRTVLFACVAGVLIVATPAQTTHLVGAGGLPQIRDALAIASPGDVILVQPGLYAHFAATVGVTIRALVPGTVDVEYQAAFSPPGCLTNQFCAAFQGPTQLIAPAGQTVHVVGLRFLPNVVPALVPNIFVRHRVAVSSGRATFDECELRATDMSALMIQNATAHLEGCTVEVLGTAINGYGMIATNAMVTAIDTTFAGNSTQVAFNLPGEGIRLQGSSLHGSNLTVTGGSALPSGTGGVAVRADGSSSLWISDSTLTCGTNGCPLVAPGAMGRITRSVLSPVIATCASLPPGPLLGVERPSPLLIGALFTLDHRTEPNAFVAIFASPDITSLAVPLLEQPLYLSPATAFSATLVLADPTGFASASWFIPAVPAFVDQRLWFQSVSGLALPLQASPVAGGVVR